MFWSYHSRMLKVNPPPEYLILASFSLNPPLGDYVEKIAFDEVNKSIMTVDNIFCQSCLEKIDEPEIFMLNSIEIVSVPEFLFLTEKCLNLERCVRRMEIFYALSSIIQILISI